MTEPISPDSRRSKESIAYVILIAVVLAVLVGTIELVRRRSSSTISPTSLHAAAERVARPYPRELRDALGETLVINAQPQRIASQTLGTDEILLAICPPGRVVALSSLAEDPNYSNSVDIAKQIPGRTTEGVEQVLQLHSDLIFVASYSRAEEVRLLKATGAPVFRFANFDSIADIEANIRTLGYAAGCDAEAERLITRMHDDLAAVRARVPKGEAALRVMSYGREGYTAGANSLFDDILRAAGAVNVSAENGLTGFTKLSVEKIAEWQPDAIVTGGNPGELESVRRQLLANPVIAASKAGRSGRVFVMDNRHFLTVSQHVVRALQDLADKLYGKKR